MPKLSMNVGEAVKIKGLSPMYGRIVSLRDGTPYVLIVEGARKGHVGPISPSRLEQADKQVTPIHKFKEQVEAFKSQKKKPQGKSYSEMESRIDPGTGKDTFDPRLRIYDAEIPTLQDLIDRGRLPDGLKQPRVRKVLVHRPNWRGRRPYYQIAAGVFEGRKRAPVAVYQFNRQRQIRDVLERVHILPRGAKVIKKSSRNEDMHSLRSKLAAFARQNPKYAPAVREILREAARKPLGKKNDYNGMVRVLRSLKKGDKVEIFYQGRSGATDRVVTVSKKLSKKERNEGSPVAVYTSSGKTRGRTPKGGILKAWQDEIWYQPTLRQQVARVTSLEKVPADATTRSRRKQRAGGAASSNAAAPTPAEPGSRKKKAPTKRKPRKKAPAKRKSQPKKPKVKIVGTLPKPRRNTRFTEGFRDKMYDYVWKNVEENLEGKIPQEVYNHTASMTSRTMDRVFRWDSGVETQEDAVEWVKKKLPEVLGNYLSAYGGADDLRKEAADLVDAIESTLPRVAFAVAHALQHSYEGRSARELKREIPKMSQDSLTRLVKALKWVKKGKWPQDLTY